jgi:hypothetical protein
METIFQYFPNRTSCLRRIGDVGAYSKLRATVCSGSSSHAAPRLGLRAGQQGSRYLERYRPTSATATASTRCDTPSCGRAGSRISGDSRVQQALPERASGVVMSPPAHSKITSRGFECQIRRIGPASYRSRANAVFEGARHWAIRTLKKADLWLYPDVCPRRSHPADVRLGRRSACKC